MGTYAVQSSRFILWGGRYNPDGCLAFQGYLGGTANSPSVQYVDYAGNNRTKYGFICPDYFWQDEYKVYGPYGVTGYSMNPYISFESVSDNAVTTSIKNILKSHYPTKTFLWADGNGWKIWIKIDDWTLGSRAVPRHTGFSAFFSFIDGHAEKFNINQIKAVSDAPYSYAPWNNSEYDILYY